MASTERQAQIEKGLRRISDLIILARGARALTTAVSLGVFDTLADGPKDAVSRLPPPSKTDPRRDPAPVGCPGVTGIACQGPRRLRQRAGRRGFPRQRCTQQPQRPISATRRHLAHAWADLPEVVRAGTVCCPLSSLLWEDPNFTRQYIRGIANIARHGPCGRAGRPVDLSHMRTTCSTSAADRVASIEAVLAKASHGARAHVIGLAAHLGGCRRVAGQVAGAARTSSSGLGNYHDADFGKEAFDLVFRMSHITQDEGEAENQNLLRLKKAFTALKPGGQAVIHDFMLAPDRTTPLFGTLFSLHMLVYTPKGRTYSAEEYGSWMSGCGFKQLRQIDICIQSPTASKALIGTKP